MRARRNCTVQERKKRTNEKKKKKEEITRQQLANAAKEKAKKKKKKHCVRMRWYNKVINVERHSARNLLVKILSKLTKPKRVREEITKIASSVSFAMEKFIEKKTKQGKSTHFLQVQCCSNAKRRQLRLFAFLDNFRIYSFFLSFYCYLFAFVFLRSNHAHLCNYQIEVIFVTLIFKWKFYFCFFFVEATISLKNNKWTWIRDDDYYWTWKKMK